MPDTSTQIEPQHRVKNILSKATKSNTMLGLKSRDIAELLGDMKSQIAQALPKHLTADRVIQMAATLITRNPAIAECTVQSLVGAVMQASILGFRPVEALGECYFVPFNVKVKQADGTVRYEKQVIFLIGYKGYITLARRSRELKMIYAECVREGDAFDFELGLNPLLKHKPNPDTADTPLTHVYAVAHYLDGGYNFVVLTIAQVERYRLRSQNQSAEVSHIWLSDYEAMAQKTAIRRLAKYLPISIDYMDTALSLDGAVLQPNDFAADGSGENLQINNVEATVISEGPTEPIATTVQPKTAQKETGSTPVSTTPVSASASTLTPEELAEYERQKQLQTQQQIQGKKSWL